MVLFDNGKQTDNGWESAAISAINSKYKVSSDTPAGKDPDTYSRTLRDAHRLLWSKRLPSGKVFNLTAKQTTPYHLYHSSDLGYYDLSSDAITHTYSRWKRKSMANIIKAMPQNDINTFYDSTSALSAYIIFPANKIDGENTINQARGVSPRISDRFDLTLECIRRWYSDIESPLSEDIDRYGDYFRLFKDFQGYFKFFLLDDLVDTDSGDIRFWLPFTDFSKIYPVPTNVEEYRNYMKNVLAFVKARGVRMAEWTKTRDVQ